MEECGAGNHLASWKQVVGQHGLRVRLWGLKQNTIPHVPHRLLKPGHSVPWPENREFVISKRYWKEPWREELNCEQDTPDWGEFIGSADTGMPTIVEFTEAAVTAIAKHEHERAIHPGHSGPKYDVEHDLVLEQTRPRVGQSKTKGGSLHFQAEETPVVPGSRAYPLRVHARTMQQVLR